MGICFSSDDVINKNDSLYRVYRDSGLLDHEVPLLRCNCEKKKDYVKQMICIYNNANRGSAIQLHFDLNTYFSIETGCYHQCQEIRAFLRTTAVLKIVKFCFQKFVDERKFDNCKNVVKTLKRLRGLIGPWNLKKFQEKEKLVTLIYSLNVLCLAKLSPPASQVSKLVKTYQETPEYGEICLLYTSQKISVTLMNKEN